LKTGLFKSRIENASQVCWIGVSKLSLETRKVGWLLQQTLYDLAQTKKKIQPLNIHRFEVADSG
jgi:hypothetical protein